MQNLQIKTQLHGNPKSAPRFSSEIKMANGAVAQAVDPKATRALVSLMDMYAVLGGAACHYGGPAAFAELMSATHAVVFDQALKNKREWHQDFHIINDAGHCENGLYALKANYGLGLTLNELKNFRSIQSRLTGHGEVHLFPEAVFLSNGPLGSSLPQAQGLAMADHKLGNTRVTITAISDGALMEGEAREALAAIPGFAKKKQLNPFILIVSDNNTKLTGRIDQDSFSMEPSIASLATLGWKVLSLPEGNDLQKCVQMFEHALDLVQSHPEQPIVIHAKTIKGIGSKKTAESASGGHGFPLKSPQELPAFLSEIYNGESYPAEFNQWVAELVEIEKSIKAQATPPSIWPEKEEKIQVGVAEALINARKKNLPIVSITSDLPGSTGLAAFRKDFPADSFDVGVAESNMISVAAGFSKLGFIPVVDTFAQFGVTKGALPLTMASLSQAPIIGIFSHTGFQDAADGASHQALSYLSQVSSIPHVKVYQLSCSQEASQLLTQAIEEFVQVRKQGNIPSSYIFFLGRENFPKNFGVKEFQLDQPQVYYGEQPTGSQADGVIFASGSVLPEALKAQAQLAQHKKSFLVVNPSRMNFTEGVKSLLTAIKPAASNFVFVEDHQAIYGMGEHLISQLNQQGLTFRSQVLGVQGEFGQSAYNAIELYEKHKLSATAIVKAAMALGEK